MEEPLPWILAAFTLLFAAVGFVLFLWFFRVKRLVYLKSITCPERDRRATVTLIARVGESGAYRDVKSCSILEGEKELSCRKSCLTSPAVIAAPSIVAWKDWGERRSNSEPPFGEGYRRSQGGPPGH